MKKNRTVKIISGCLATVVMLVLVLGCITNIFERKASRNKFEEFYQQDMDFDVLFLGTSHVDGGISPMDMWEQNGIVGYNMATPGCRIATAYWVIRNALQYTEPKLIVLDCAYLLDHKANSNINYMHRVFDSMPFSNVKVEALLDLYDEKEDILRFLFPFSLYHNRWNELTKSDLFFTPQYGKMGINPGCDAVNAEIPKVMADEAVAIDNISTQYLESIIELCREEEMDLLLTFIPFLASESSQNDAAYLRVLANQHGIAYLDPVQLLELLNLKTDFINNNDDNSHVNLSGAHKISYYLGNFIQEHYQIPDRREDPAYQQWHRYYEQYAAYKQVLLHGQESINPYLVAAADKNYTIVLQIENWDILEDDMAVNLLCNLGIDPEELHEKKDCLIVNGSEETEFTITRDTEGNPICLQDNTHIYSWGNTSKDADVFVLVVNKEDMQIVDAAAFLLEQESNVFNRIIE